MRKESSLPAIKSRERRIAFHEKFVQRTGFARLELWPAGINIRMIFQPRFAVRRRHQSLQITNFSRVLIIEPPQPIRQPEQWRSQPHAQRIRKPFRQKIDARFRRGA